MPNGRNAGRLFADCYGREGYGRSHAIGLPNGEPVTKEVEKESLEHPVEVKCHSTCKGDFLMCQGELVVLGGYSSIPEHRLQERLDAAEQLAGVVNSVLYIWDLPEAHLDKAMLEELRAALEAYGRCQ